MYAAGIVQDFGGLYLSGLSTIRRLLKSVANALSGERLVFVARDEVQMGVVNVLTTGGINIPSQVIAVWVVFIYQGFKFGQFLF